MLTSRLPPPPGPGPKALRTSSDMAARGFAAVLTRRVLNRDMDGSMWKNLPPAVQGQVKSELLASLRDEEQRYVYTKVGDTVAVLATSVDVDEGGWPELLPFLFQCVQAGQDRLLGSSLHIFAEIITMGVPLALLQHLDSLHAVMGQCMGSQNAEVRLAALRACSYFIRELETPAHRNKFQDLIPHMLRCLEQALHSGDENDAQAALEMFIDVGENQPRFLRKQLVAVVSAVLTVVEMQDLMSDTRQLASEFLITLAEARDKAPGMMRKLPDFAPRLFQICVSFLLDIEDEAEWHSALDTHENAGEGDMYDVGQDCLDRLSIAIGGKTIMPLAGQVLPVLLKDEDWRKRHAVLITLAQIAEGCQKVLLNQISSAVDCCVQGIQDAHPRVRWASCHAMGQLCIDLGPDIQTDEHMRIVPALLQAMEDPSPRVQAHAACAMVNFASIEEDPSDSQAQKILQPYLGILVGKLLQLLQSPHKMVQEGSLTAMASIADSAQDAFENYYATVVPILMQIMTQTQGEDTRVLRSRAVECLSLVAMAVGKDRFRPDAEAVMQALMHMQATCANDDDTSTYMLQAWTRLCKCLGQEFVPYLQVVMPPLLKSARLEADVTSTDITEGAEEEEDEDLAVLILGDQRIAIRTSTLEEKATAINMLVCYIAELKGAFFPYIDEVVELLVGPPPRRNSLLGFFFHEEVRMAAANALPELVNAAKDAVEKGCGKDFAWVKAIFEQLLEPLLQALSIEPEMFVQEAQLQSLSEMITASGESTYGTHGACGTYGISPETMGLVMECIHSAVKRSATRREERNQRQQAEDFDEEEQDALEEENEAEDDIMDAVADCLGSLLKTFHSTVLPQVEQLLLYVTGMLEGSPKERRIAICIIDDIIEHASEGGATVKYLQPFMPILLKNLTGGDEDLRQCAGYGLGLCAEKLGAAFQPYCAQTLGGLSQCLQDPQARSKDWAVATDNVVSALGKVMEHQAASLDAATGPQVGAGWLSFLPLTHDKGEGKVVHEQLCRFVEARDVRVLGAQGENLPRIVGVMAHVLGEGEALLGAGNKDRMLALAQQIGSTLPADVLQQQTAALPPEAQQIMASLKA